MASITCGSCAATHDSVEKVKACYDGPRPPSPPRIATLAEDGTHCGAPVIPILYGLPSEELFERERAGDIILAGCMIWNQAPKWKCATCGAREGDPILA